MPGGNALVAGRGPGVEVRETDDPGLWTDRGGILYAGTEGRNFAGLFPAPSGWRSSRQCRGTGHYFPREFHGPHECGPPRGVADGKLGYASTVPDGDSERHVCEIRVRARMGSHPNASISDIDASGAFGTILSCVGSSAPKSGGKIRSNQGGPE